jgi:hypothetical protein
MYMQYLRPTDLEMDVMVWISFDTNADSYECSGTRMISEFIYNTNKQQNFYSLHKR